MENYKIIMKSILILILLIVTTFAIWLGLIIIPNHNFKSFSIYKLLLRDYKLIKSTYYKPKFIIIIIPLFIITAIDIILFVLFIFLINNEVFKLVVFYFSISKLFIFGLLMIFIYLLDYHYYKLEKRMSEDELNKIMDNVKPKHPNFFNN